ncbi:Protein ras-2 [Mycena sanguinolenta]|uniref:Protein ras-2 n=1 Tax=Mycena sanguinolenta TaxID=230812 RepID=A0A8H7CV66_9AGAR|nr:Protein ras-2 [Mycena sanguinolenta]
MVLLSRNRRKATTQPQPQVICKEHKLMVVGEGGVGKLALLIQFIQRHFSPEYEPSHQDSFRKRLVVDDESVLVDIYSTHGNEISGSLLDHISQVCVGFLLVYSITQRSTFNAIRTHHEHICRIKEQDASAPIIIVGNKSDLEAKRVVSMEEGRDLATELGCTFIETSAKQDVNVEEAFIDVVRRIPPSNKALLIRCEPQGIEAGGEDEHLLPLGDYSLWFSLSSASILQSLFIRALSVLVQLHTLAVLPDISRVQVTFKEYKLVLVGEGGNTISLAIISFNHPYHAGVGKSTLNNCFVYGHVPEEYDPTLMEDYQRRLIIDDVPVQVDINNTHTNEGFGGLSDYDARMGDGFLLVYSITQRNTFNRIRTYHDHIRRIKGPDAVGAVVVVGNKSELGTKREVSVKEGQDLAKELGCMFMETSARQGMNVEEAFVDVVRQIWRSNKAHSNPGECQGVNGGSEDEHSSRCSGCIVF